MFQRFHDISQLTRVIKQILATEPIPVLQTLNNNYEIAVPGCSYVVDGTIHKCISPSSSGFSYLTSDVQHQTYQSDVSWYDSNTHKYLGDYLRYLRDTTSVNLMRYYNCYAATELNDIHIRLQEKIPLTPSEDKTVGETNGIEMICGGITVVENPIPYKFESNSQVRVVAVPIRFNTEYRIAVESADPVLLGAVIYDPDIGMIPHSSGSGYYSDSEVLVNTYRSSANSRFRSPLAFKVPLTSSASDAVELYSRQSNLYMILQLSARTTSSIVVLEWDETWDTNSLSLLQYNTGISYAFSDRLIEYLLHNVITSEETLTRNISRVQYSITAMDVLDKYPQLKSSIFDGQGNVNKSIVAEYRPASTGSLGVWNDNIQTRILDIVSKYPDLMHSTFDQDGNINKDVEYLLASLGVYKT